MALWQYSIYIVSNSDIEGKTVDENILLKAKGWEKSNISFDIKKLIERILPKTSSWSQSIDLWGKEDSTCVEMFLGNTDNVELIHIRLDFRERHSKQIINTIIELVKLLNASIISNYKIIENNEQSILIDMSKSPAFKFVSNPDSFFNDLGDTDSKNQ
ncbi:MAG: hypothetical protein HQK49_13140 [Oligoflexia bacterium]|nr:hypothetical protein [Oligoflexia bacterium]